MNEALKQGKTCPDAEALSALLDRRGTGAEQAAIAAHVAECAHCTAELALLREFESGEPTPDEAEAIEWITQKLNQPKVLTMKPAARQPWRRYALLAASLVLAAGLTMRLRPGGNDAGHLNPATTNDVLRSQDLRAISPLGDVKQTPDELKWNPVAGAANYRVRLLEIDRTEVWVATSPSPNLPIPAAVRSQIAAGRSFLWEVIALDSKGQTIGTTSLQKFHISMTTK